MTEHDDLPRDPALSRRYREANANDELAPPAALDASILTAARAAVQPPPRPERPWWQRLTLPVGIAATTLLAVMLSLTVQRQTPETLEHAPTGNTAPAAAPAPRAPEAAPTDSVPSAPPSRAERAPQTAEKKTVPPPAAPAALPAAGAPPAAMPAPAASHDAAGVSARLKAETAADRATEAEARAPLQKAAPAAAPSRLDAAKGTVAMPAEAWIEEIRELRRLGRAEDAARRLAEFRQIYPEYVLPADLR